MYSITIRSYCIISAGTRKNWQSTGDRSYCLGRCIYSSLFHHWVRREVYLFTKENQVFHWSNEPCGSLRNLTILPVNGSGTSFRISHYWKNWQGRSSFKSWIKWLLKSSFQKERFLHSAFIHYNPKTKIDNYYTLSI